MASRPDSGRRLFFRALMRAYPAGFRDAFGAEMEAAFDECWTREVSRAPIGGPVFAATHAIADTIRQALAVRAAARREARLDRRRFNLVLHGASGAPSSRGPRMSQIGQDIRFALRGLMKDRSFTATVLLTLAICIGANAAIFAIVQSVLLRPLPVPEPDRLVYLYNSYPNAGVERASSGVPDYFDRLTALTALEELALYRPAGATIGFDSGVERLQGMQATPSLFRVLRARAALGTVFQEADGVPGNDLKIILAHSLWQSHFGGAPDVVGRQMRVNGRSLTIVGVMPRDFNFLRADTSFWTPLAFRPEEKSDDRRHSNSYQSAGRLKPGASVDQAQAQLDALNRANDERFPAMRQVLKDAGFTSRVVPFQADLVREIRPVLYLLWGGVVFVLLIGAVNVTNLVVVRSSARQRELATRHAIGAGLSRLASQLLTETMLLAAAGGVLGLLLGRAALSLAPTLGIDELPRGYEIRMDISTLAITFGASLLVGLLVGLIPVLRLWRLNLNLALRDEGRGGTASRRSMLARRVMATAQVGLAFLLLVGAGLLFTSFRRVLGVAPGFVADGVVSGAINLPRAKYADGPAARAFQQRTLDRLRAIAGIEQVGLVDILPFSGDSSDGVILAEGYVMKPGESLISPLETSVSDQYFETMRIPVVSGRSFDARDTAASPEVIVIDQKLARRFWGDKDPVGRRMWKPDGPEDLVKPGPKSHWFTVVGVVQDVKQMGLTGEDQRVGAYYYPMTQVDARSFCVVARTSLPADTIAAAIRREIAAVDPEVPLYNVRTMQQRVDESLVSRRLPMLLAVAFGAVALFLSAIGIYGVLAYQVAQRRREIGIRMALGSTVRAVYGLVLGDGARIVSVGLVLGLIGAFATGKYIETQLFGVRAMDPIVVASVAVLLAAVSFAAVSIPARRAAKVSPVIALAGE